MVHFAAVTECVTTYFTKTRGMLAYHATHCLPWESQRWKCEWVEAAVNCGMWWTTDSWGCQGIEAMGGVERLMVHPRALSWLPSWPGRWPAEWEEEETRNKRKAGKDNVVWPVLIFLWSGMKDTAEGVGGCQSGKEASSICHLYFSLSSCYLVFPPTSSLFPRLCPAVSGFSWECSKGK